MLTVLVSSSFPSALSDSRSNFSCCGGFFAAWEGRTIRGIREGERKARLIVDEVVGHGGRGRGEEGAPSISRHSLSALPRPTPRLILADHLQPNSAVLLKLLEGCPTLLSLLDSSRLDWTRLIEIAIMMSALNEAEMATSLPSRVVGNIEITAVNDCKYQPSGSFWIELATHRGHGRANEKRVVDHGLVDGAEDIKIIRVNVLHAMAARQRSTRPPPK
eukprot:762947-Hanusia_phi.AAC.10